jgi:hypothetical protein
MCWASGCGITCWPVFVSTRRSTSEGIKVEDLPAKGFRVLCCPSLQVGEGDPELGAYRFSPVPSVWAPSRYGLPPDSHLLERPVCGAVFMPTAPMRGSGGSRPPGGKKGRRTLVVAALRLFCWKAYTLALTQRGVALHWHASKTAPPDAELGAWPGDVERVDGAEGLGRRDESAARGVPGGVSDSGKWDFGTCKILGDGLEDSVEEKTRCVASSARHPSSRSPLPWPVAPPT